MTAPASIRSLIDDNWRTIVEFSLEIGCGYEAARQMRRRGRIAPEHWAAVVAACKQRRICGVTLEWLAQKRAANARQTMSTPQTHNWQKPSKSRRALASQKSPTHPDMSEAA